MVDSVESVDADVDESLLTFYSRPLQKLEESKLTIGAQERDKNCYAI